jgi:glucose/arabinose dehydrogenase
VDKRPYAIPSDNPYVNTKNARPEIWASGFRKMWRYSFDPETDQLFGGDVGELQEEEINIVNKGANYGWPLKEGNSIGDKTDSTNTSILTAPIHNYPRNVGICIIGGYIYHGKGIPLLNNKYVFADFNGSIFALVKNEKEDWIRQPVKIINKPGGVLLICGLNVAENNELYIMGFLNSETGSQGVVYKMVKA